MSSDVARFREQYELEYQAAKQGLEGLAMVASHQFITKRMENMQQAHATLQTIVGTEEAIRLVVQTLENVQEVRAL